MQDTSTEKLRVPEGLQVTNNTPSISKIHHSTSVDVRLELHPDPHAKNVKNVLCLRDGGFSSSFDVLHGA
jgi:hypothetical protein